MFQGLICFLVLVWFMKLSGGKKDQGKADRYVFFKDFIDKK